MSNRDYYSARKAASTKIDLKLLKNLFRILYEKYSAQGYFQKYLGFECVNGYVEGDVGFDVEGFVFLKLRKNGLWPVQTKVEFYNEEDFFTIIEFLYDHISKPLDGWWHTYRQCGMHYNTFNDLEGQEIYRKELNHILKDYGAGYELSVGGEIINLAVVGFSFLMQAPIPTEDDNNVKKRIEVAILKFRKYSSTRDERREVIRDLADVLEFLRPQAKEYLQTADESDLFNLANNYGTRHHRQDQKVDYDVSIWYTWMFYYYLATIHALLRLIEKGKESST